MPSWSAGFDFNVGGGGSSSSAPSSSSPPPPPPPPPPAPSREVPCRNAFPNDPAGYQACMAGKILPISAPKAPVIVSMPRRTPVVSMPRRTPVVSMPQRRRVAPGTLRPISVDGKLGVISIKLPAALTSEAAQAAGQEESLDLTPGAIVVGIGLLAILGWFFFAKRKDEPARPNPIKTRNYRKSRGVWIGVREAKRFAAEIPPGTPSSDVRQVAYMKALEAGATQVQAKKFSDRATWFYTQEVRPLHEEGLDLWEKGQAFENCYQGR